ncbi:ketopantoate reductase family protein [Thalassomonas sp. M1454]|uniref:ketopantoate reductase family protein n=1 Tax=Thalassomonas sp. M1454 TaxID=2594477 RepID=UPI00163D4672|nr:2-dehydropantoate 2-reductase [Thalassomonas sp. M1454]
MNIVIVGSGAMGLLFYQQLNTQADVRIKTRSNDNIYKSFTYTDLHGCNTSMQYQTADEAFMKTADIVLICVKSYDVANVVSSIKDSIAENTIIILMHNGMGVIEELNLTTSPKNPIYTLLTTQAARKLAKNHVKHTGIGINQIGPVNNHIGDREILDLLVELSTNDIGFEFCNSITLLQWKKLAINCAVNALTAINNINNGELSAAAYSKIIESITSEVIIVAELEGISLDITETLNTIKTVIKNTSMNSSSMREDVKNKRRTEVSYINGYIHNLGLRHGLLTPENTKLFEQVSNLEANYG